MKPGDLVRFKPRSEQRSTESRCGIIISGPTPANGTFGVLVGSLYEVLIREQICFMFEFELEPLNEAR